MLAQDALHDKQALPGVSIILAIQLSLSRLMQSQFILSAM